MKQFFLALLFFPLSIMAQEESDYEYQPLVVEGKTWHMNQNDVPPIVGTWTFYISGDTIIDDHNCKKLLVTMDDEDTKEFYSNVFKCEGDFVVYAYLYEENKKVYCYTVNSYKAFKVYDKHFLLYDFGMNVGDKQGIFTVCSVDTVDFHGVKRRVLHIRGEGSASGVDELWIEGLGTYYPFNPGFSAKSGGSSLNMVDCTLEDNILITGEDWNLSGVINDIKTPYEPNVTHGNDAVYDLQGRRVQIPQRGGLYIKNGRKFLQR